MPKLSEISISCQKSQNKLENAFRVHRFFDSKFGCSYFWWSVLLLVFSLKLLMSSTRWLCLVKARQRNETTKKLNKSLLAEVRGRKNRREFVNSLHVCDQSDKLCVWLYSSHHHHHENVIYIAHISSCQAIFVTFLSCVRFSFFPSLRIFLLNSRDAKNILWERKSHK